MEEWEFFTEFFTHKLLKNPVEIRGWRNTITRESYVSLDDSIEAIGYKHKSASKRDFKERHGERMKLEIKEFPLWYDTTSEKGDFLSEKAFSFLIMVARDMPIATDLKEWHAEKIVEHRKMKEDFVRLIAPELIEDELERNLYLTRQSKIVLERVEFIIQEQIHQRGVLKYQGVEIQSLKDKQKQLNGDVTKRLEGIFREVSEVKEALVYILPKHLYRLKQPIRAELLPFMKKRFPEFSDQKFYKQFHGIIRDWFGRGEKLETIPRDRTEEAFHILYLLKEDVFNEKVSPNTYFNSKKEFKERLSKEDPKRTAWAQKKMRGDDPLPLDSFI